MKVTLKVTRELVAEKLADYLRHCLSLADLVSWAEEAMQEGEFDEQHMDTIREVVARLGLADTKAFGLTWEECKASLRQLGYEAHVEITAASA